jgi:hypothetical protein
VKSALARATTSVAVVVLGLGLSACGGGGGGGGSSPIPQTPTTAVPPPGSITASTQSINLAGKANSVDAVTQPITVTVTGSSSPDVQVSYTVAGKALLSVINETHNGQTFSAFVAGKSAMDLGAGVHTGTLTITACDFRCTRQLNGSPITIPVSYEITGISATASNTTLELTNASASPLTSTLTVRTYPEMSWTAQANQPWLHLSRTTSEASDLTPLEVSIDSAHPELTDGVRTASVKVTSATGETFQAMFAINVHRTQIDRVAPAIATSTDQSEVILRGHVFDTGTITGVRFGNRDAPAFRIVSPTEIRSTLPLLDAGVYPVSVTGSGANLLSFATLRVVDPTNYAQRRLSNFGGPGTVLKTLYEPARRTVFVAMRPSSGDHDFIAAYSFSSTDWVASQRYESRGVLRSMIMGSAVESVLLSEDGFTWKNNGFSDEAIALTYMDYSQSHSYIYVDGWATNFMRDMAIANDGRAIAVSGNDSDLPGSVFTYPSALSDDSSFIQLLPMKFANDAPTNVFNKGVVAGSGDGSRVLLADSATGSKIYEYDSSTGQLRDTQKQATATEMQLDRTGNHVLLDRTRAYNHDLQLLGQLPATTLASVFSPKGDAIYTFDSSGQFIVWNSSTLAKIREWPALNSPGDLTKPVSMTIAPDERTLFVAGSDAVLVEPISQ